MNALMDKTAISAYLRHSERAVIGVDGRGRIDFANPAAGRLFQLEAETLVGRPLEDWITDSGELSGLASNPSPSSGPFIRQGQRTDGTELSLVIQAVSLGEEYPGVLALELEAQDRSLTEIVQGHRLIEMIERTPNPIGMADAEGRVLYLNPGFWRFVGLNPGRFPAPSHIEQFHPPWAMSRIREEALPAAKAEGFWEGEAALWNAAGEETPVLLTLHAHYHADGSVAYYSTIFQDITALREQETRLRLFYEILDNLGAYVFCKDRQFRFTYANAQVCRLFQRPLEGIIGQTDEAFFGKEGAREILEHQDKPVLVEGRNFREEERRYIASSGEYRYFLVVKKPLYGEDKDIQGLYGIATDITELKEREKRLAYQANHDPLTGIPNRSAAEAFLERHIKLTGRHGTPVSVIMLDVDHFKTINDRLGHDAGDQVLIRLTAVLGAHVRETDILARWGGEEFLVGAPETELQGACELAERLRSAVEQEVVREAPGSGTLSAGVAQYQAGDSLRSWVRRADRALYEAKNAGRNRVNRGD